MPRLTELVERAERIAVQKGIEVAKKDWFDNSDWFEYMRAHPQECRAEEHRELISEFQGEPLISRIPQRETMNVNKSLKELNLPILLFNEEGDLEEFIRAAKHMNAEIDDCQFVLIPKSGGLPCWENPHEVNRIVSIFLDKILK